jgi:hypothetical protein
MNEKREMVRCQSCELVQWSDRVNCRRCRSALPEQVVTVVERVVRGGAGHGMTRCALRISRRRAD